MNFPAWFNKDDVAIGKDAVVDKALEWINNLVYPHNVYLIKHIITSDDSVHLLQLLKTQMHTNFQHGHISKQLPEI